MQPKHPVSAARRVLVADDNRDAGESLAMLLRLDGHEVHVATNGLDAVELYSRMLPDVAILDIACPVFPFSKWRAHSPAGQHPARMLIAVTGWGQQADKERAVAVGLRSSLHQAGRTGRASRLLGRRNQEARPNAS